MKDKLIAQEKKENLLKYYRQMLEIRSFEEKVMELLSRNVVQGGSHLYAGEEAVAVGACAAIRQDDYITSTHRGHGHCLAKGGKLPIMLAELLGKSTGYNRGRGGSLHIADLGSGNLGANGIVGGGIPIANGAALSIKMRKTDQVVLCFFGDGAINTGAFHEALNMGAVWSLPVIYICENNLYGMSGAVSRVCAVKDLAIRAVAYNIPQAIVDGMDALAVKNAVSQAVERARAGKGPTLIECKTYRYYGHSRSDPRVYRTKEEEEFWREKDPIQQFRRRLLENQVATQEELKEIDALVAQEIAEAEKFALESPYPSPEALYEGVYVE